MIKLSSLAVHVNVFELMIDWRHPDGGLRVLISCLFEILYPSFSFFFRFKMSGFRSCMRIYENIRCYPGDVSAVCLYVETRCGRIKVFFCLRVIYSSNFACD